MKSLGDTIRSLREERQLPLRTVAAFLDIDQAILSKIERGQRKPARHQVVQLAKYFKVEENDLLVQWLSDKLVYELEDEEMALKALQVAEEKVAYKTFAKTDRNSKVKAMKDFFKKDGRVLKAWIFGSFAREEDKPGSDIDVMVKYSDKASGTLLDYADIQFNLEKILNCKIDLVEEGYIKPFAWNNLKNDLKLIYG